MKTTKSTSSFPKTEKIIVYCLAVAVFCLLSIMVPQAQDKESLKYNAELENLRLISVEESEPTIQLESWMLEIRTED
jgi:hypothetical protein